MVNNLVEAHSYTSMSMYVNSMNSKGTSEQTQHGLIVVEADLRQHNHASNRLYPKHIGLKHAMAMAIN